MTVSCFFAAQVSTTHIKNQLVKLLPLFPIVLLVLATSSTNAQVACAPSQYANEYLVGNAKVSDSGGCERTGAAVKINFFKAPSQSGADEIIRFTMYGGDPVQIQEYLVWSTQEIRRSQFNPDRSSVMSLSNLPDWVDQLIEKQSDLFIKHSPILLKARSDEKNKSKNDEIIAANALAEVKRAKADEATKQAAASLATQQFRDGLGKMNAGQLFAKADELSSQGDTAKARETLRMLISKFPDHPLVAPAAQQLATMSAASANAANTGGSNNAASNGGASNVSVQSGGSGNCWDILARKEKEYEAINRRPVPGGATPGLMRVMWMTEDSIKVIDANCAGDAKAAKYRGELVTAYNQAKTACGQMIAGGQCKANAF